MSPRSIRAVVIGSSGQVARSLLEELPRHEITPVPLSRPAIDLADPATLREAIVRAMPDIVVNPAAYTAVDKAEDEPALAMAINRDGAGVIAAAAAEIGVPVIHFSTDYVFDGSKASPYVETDPTAPLGVYGESKLAGELAVAAANARHVILRTAWVCSPYGNNFLKTMIRLAGERPELRVVDDQRGAPTFAADLARATAALVPRLVGADARSSHFGVFHLASAGETSWCGFARAIMAELEARGQRAVPVHAIATSDYPTKARRPAYSKLATGRIADIHGIVMPQWQASLRVCLDSLLAG